MPEVDYWIPITFAATVIGYTIVIAFLWNLLMPGYIYKKIRETIGDLKGKSCYNCKFFVEQYYNDELWCQEIGLPITKVNRKCKVWQLNTFEEPEEEQKPEETQEDIINGDSEGKLQDV
jgi:hypothetical protein